MANKMKLLKCKYTKYDDVLTYLNLDKVISFVVDKDINSGKYFLKIYCADSHLKPPYISFLYYDSKEDLEEAICSIHDEIEIIDI